MNVEYPLVITFLGSGTSKSKNYIALKQSLSSRGIDTFISEFDDETQGQRVEALHKFIHCAINLNYMHRQYGIFTSTNGAYVALELTKSENPPSAIAMASPIGLNGLYFDYLEKAKCPVFIFNDANDKVDYKNNREFVEKTWSGGFLQLPGIGHDGLESSVFQDMVMNVAGRFFHERLVKNELISRHYRGKNRR